MQPNSGSCGRRRRLWSGRARRRLMGHEYGSWWCGSILTSRRRGEACSGTERDHRAGSIGGGSAVMWMIEHPREGLCTPEDLPHDYVLKIARPYLGSFCRAIGLDPAEEQEGLFQENLATRPDDDMWQFKNFVFVP